MNGGTKSHQKGEGNMLSRYREGAYVSGHGDEMGMGGGEYGGLNDGFEVRSSCVGLEKKCLWLGEIEKWCQDQVGGIKVPGRR